MNPLSQYTALAEYYDRLNSHVPYGEWADFLHRMVEKYGNGKENIWLDLACGTGVMTRALSALGHDMIGIDISPEMLSIARERSFENEQTDILWLCQDMRSFELYGTVDAVVCCLDSVNYLPDKEALLQCFRSVNNYLGPGGVFLFDVNTPYKFEQVYASNDYVLESEGVYCGWQNDFDTENGICTFDLTIFAEQANGEWHRYDEVQQEFCHSEALLREALHESGLEVIGFWSNFLEKPATPNDERWFFLCKGTGKETLVS